MGLRWNLIWIRHCSGIRSCFWLTSLRIQRMYRVRHPKRYSDIQELLHAGIDVYTTVNVQHLESLQDVWLQVSPEYRYRSVFRMLYLMKQIRWSWWILNRMSCLNV